MRPVTTSGRPAKGYTVTALSGVPADCGKDRNPGRGRFVKATPSQVTVDDNILQCAPTSANTIACWQAAAPLSVLCFVDPWARHVLQVRADAPAPRVTATAMARPIGIRLSDGARCSLLYNGTSAPLAADRSVGQTYGCDRKESVFAAGNSKSGIDAANPLWTAQVAASSGAGPLRTVPVLAAYFVGSHAD